MNSNRKGKVGERELAKYLTMLGFPARRRNQFSGAEGDDDIACDSLPNLFIECKRDRSINIGTAALDAAFGKAGKQKQPRQRAVIMWRQDYGAWQMSFHAPMTTIIVTASGDADIMELLTMLNGMPYAECGERKSQ